jgi:5-formyltetrahydrofolate cyclo-ligase
MVFIPGLAFDLEGNRLGRGRGFFDRFLKRLGERVPYVALAYDFQIMEGLPVEKWDERVHHIITEKRIIDCGNVMTQSGYVL